MSTFTPKPLNMQQVAQYYNNEELLNRMVADAQEREVAGAYWDGRYDKRPNIVQYASDIKNMANKGITSFHFSVERWSNAMMLASATQEKQNELRTGFDFVLDMDSKIGIDGAKACALEILRLFEKYGIKNYGMKFSGSRGFHLVIPWNAFPKEIDYKPTAKRYPEIPKILANFIANEISESLMHALIKLKTYKKLSDLLDEPASTLEPFYFVDLERGWSNRHMFRAPFSLNEKKWLASIPLTKQTLEAFDMIMALPEHVGRHLKTPFFKSTDDVEIENLLLDAIDWNARQKKEEIKVVKKVPRNPITQKMLESDFPPCIKLILNGLADGRKRSMFTLINFLNRMNWTTEEIIERVQQWNENNPRPLPRSLLIGQLRYHVGGETLPANCYNEAFYKSIGNGICRPDEMCISRKIRNPITYPFKKFESRLEKQKDDAALGNVYKCNKCDKAFSNMKSLNRHYGRMHGSV
ncbi:MAG: hypothetical protein ABIG30_02815 [Candidatus Aenigmatarchaeota archaeon]